MVLIAVNLDDPEPDVEEVDALNSLVQVTWPVPYWHTIPLYDGKYIRVYVG